MKAVVLEKRFGVAAVLKEDGTFCRMITSAKVGQEIAIKEKELLRYRVLKPIVACLMIVLMSFASWNYIVVDAYAYVTVDVETPLEISINRLNQVIDVEPVSDNGEEMAFLLKQEIKGMRADEAMNKTREILEKRNLLKEEKDYILIDIVSDSSETRERLKNEAEKAFVTENDHVIINSFEMEYRNEAHEHQLSPGRYRQIEEIRDKEGNAKEIDEYKNESIEELFKQTESYHDSNNKTKAEELAPNEEAFHTEDSRDSDPKDAQTDGEGRMEERSKEQINEKDHE
ncbi:MAG: hypothetical protein IJI66_05700 [Erysipelotrichaceae bacterium]|nr:hypothetical protein [Erysipelotrichaceae bacterium]